MRETSDGEVAMIARRRAVLVDREVSEG